MLSDKIKSFTAYNNFTLQIYSINEKITNDSIKFNNYDSISEKTYRLNLLNENRFIVYRSLKEYDKKKDTLGKIKAYRNLGNYYLKKNIIDSAFYFFDKVTVMLKKMLVFR